MFKVDQDRFEQKIALAMRQLGKWGWRGSSFFHVCGIHLLKVPCVHMCRQIFLLDGKMLLVLDSQSRSVQCAYV